MSNSPCKGFHILTTLYRAFSYSHVFLASNYVLGLQPAGPMRLWHASRSVCAVHPVHILVKFNDVTSQSSFFFKTGRASPSTSVSAHSLICSMSHSGLFDMALKNLGFFKKPKKSEFRFFRK